MSSEPDRAAQGQFDRRHVEAIRLVVAARHDVAEGLAVSEIELLTPEQAGSSGWLMRWLDGPDGWAWQAEADADTLPGRPKVEATDGHTVILRPWWR